MWRWNKPYRNFGSLQTTVWARVIYLLVDAIRVSTKEDPDGLEAVRRCVPILEDILPNCRIWRTQLMKKKTTWSCDKTNWVTMALEWYWYVNLIGEVEPERSTMHGGFLHLFDNSPARDLGLDLNWTDFWDWIANPSDHFNMATNQPEFGIVLLSITQEISY